MTRLRCSNHTPCPGEYVEWRAWALKKSEKYRQVRCRQCGQYAIWTRKTDNRRYFIHRPAELEKNGVGAA